MWNWIIGKFKRIESKAVTKYRVVADGMYRWGLEYFHEGKWLKIPTIRTAFMDYNWNIGVVGFIHTVYTYQDPPNDLYSFAKSYPDISKYFEKMRKEQQKHKDELAKMDRTTKYL